MCGRYTLAADEQHLVEVFDIPSLTFSLTPSFNVAPGQPAVVVAADSRGRRGGLLQWGLVPGWMDEPGNGFINARSESVAEKPSFRDAFARRRCLVPADGFYEWQTHAEGKTPYWIHPVGGGVVALAGIWETWSRPGADPKHAFAILTTDANADMKGVHDRMPVTIPREAFGDWLDRSSPSERVRSLLTPAPAGTFALHPVSPRVNRPSENDAMLIEAVA